MNLKIECHPLWRWQFSRERGTQYWEMPHDWVVRIGPFWIQYGDKMWRKETPDE